jgi:ferredoxin
MSPLLSIYTYISMDQKNIHIDEDLCIGCGSCPAVAPETFEMGDDDKAHVLPEVTDDDDTVVAARDCCPTQAISLDS